MTRIAMPRLTSLLLRAGILLALVAFAWGGWTWWSKATETPPEARYQFDTVTASDVTQTVTANGTVNPVNLVNVGNAQILTIPGEALPNIGYYLKRKMRGQHHLLFGLTNDAFGYILTKEDYDSFKRYEYVSRTSLGEHTGEILVNEVLKLVAESPAPEKLPGR